VQKNKSQKKRTKKEGKEKEKSRNVASAPRRAMQHARGEMRPTVRRHVAAWQRQGKIFHHLVGAEGGVVHGDLLARQRCARHAPQGPARQTQSNLKKEKRGKEREKRKEKREKRNEKRKRKTKEK
jgi:hypothetical protein